MSDMDELRSLVQSRKGQWSRIARITGLSTKTLSRIANGETPDVRLSTDRKIRDAVAQIAQPLAEPEAA
jgi:DNA-binding Xre family transcriptional regulator